MSISDDLQRALDRGALVPLPMRLDSDPCMRDMFLSKEICELVLGPYLTPAHSVRASRLWADLEAFVRGDEISMGLTPHKHKFATFGRLKPVADLVFDFRSRDPSPSIRLLGHFESVDCFVALSWWPKQKKVDWSDKEPLQKDETKWRHAMMECTNSWFDILPNSVPVSGTQGDRYVSSNLIISGT